MASLKIDKYTDVVIYAVIGVLFVSFASRAFVDSYLWYDEAGQFYISKGLFHYSEPYANYGNLEDSLFYNRYFNLDPGGFGIILHFWSKISNNYVWLRLLPLLFYITSIAILYNWAFKYSKTKIKAVIMTSILLLHPVFAISSCEIRAYSMELLGVVLSLKILQLFDNKWNFKRLAILASFLGLFITSRYSFILYAFGFSLYICFWLLHNKPIKDAIYNIIGYGLILIGFIGYVVITATIYQNSGTQGVSYVENAYIANNLEALLSLSCLRFYCLIVIICYTKYKREKIPSYLSVSVIVSFVFFLSSTFDFYPMDERRAMSLTVIQCISIVAYTLNKVTKLLHERIIKLVMLSVSFSLIFIWPKLTENRTMKIEEYNSFKKIIFQLSNEESIFVAANNSPSIRYAFEEGDLKTLDKNIYLRQVILGKGGTHNDSKGVLKINIKNEKNITATYYYFNRKNHIDNKLFIPIPDMPGIYQNNK